MKNPMEGVIYSYQQAMKWVTSASLFNSCLLFEGVKQKPQIAHKKNVKKKKKATQEKEKENPHTHTHKKSHTSKKSC